MMMTRSITTEEATSCHSPALLSQLASTQQLDTEQLQQLAASWDCVYLHNNIWPAAERAAGGVIDLVSGEAVFYDDLLFMSFQVRAVVRGKVDNGMALVRPPGHHAMRDER